ncbi:right-handed parallel beta-helix repeat-containing protein [Candidatus Laterigemmans baculatus]|uniref:right-handed parallel beta-helix repeat-containing protein n=1 Tax=Candidatus Laterigemmans baculatus TaxID=2770505 RepID=UPI0013DC6D94|nr:right-handed parallel beta-helix repeat-containing protein [Candidatus Laterigemmans baculatus]
MTLSPNVFRSARWLMLVAASLVPVAANAAELPGAAKVIDAAEYASLQAALDAVPAEGGYVRIPPGRFEISEPLQVRTTDTTIVGAGSATQLINTNEEGKPAILVGKPEFAGRATPKAERLWRVELAEMRILGNEKSGAGIEAHYIEEIFIHDLSLTEHGSHGILLNHCYEDPRLSDNLLTYNAADGIHLIGCHDIVVSANHFEENQTGLRCLDGFNLTMNGNNLDDHLGDGVIIENTYGSVLSGNMIEECQGWAIIIDRDCYGITMSANVIAHDFAGGIDLRDAHGCAVTGNSFPLVKNAAVAVRKDSGRIAITGNAFSDSYIGDGKTRRGTESTSLEENPNEATGILLETTSPVAISGNLFSGLKTPPIRSEAERQGDEANNVLVTDEADKQ